MAKTPEDGNQGKHDAQAEQAEFSRRLSEIYEGIDTAESDKALLAFLEQNGEFDLDRLNSDGSLNTDGEHTLVGNLAGLVKIYIADPTEENLLNIENGDARGLGIGAKIKKYIPPRQSHDDDDGLVGGVVKIKGGGKGKKKDKGDGEEGGKTGKKKKVGKEKKKVDPAPEPTGADTDKKVVDGEKSAEKGEVKTVDAEDKKGPEIAGAEPVKKYSIEPKVEDAGSTEGVLQPSVKEIEEINRRVNDEKRLNQSKDLEKEAFDDGMESPFAYGDFPQEEVFGRLKLCLRDQEKGTFEYEEVNKLIKKFQVRTKYDLALRRMGSDINFLDESKADPKDLEVMNLTSEEEGTVNRILSNYINGRPTHREDRMVFAPQPINELVNNAEENIVPNQRRVLEALNIAKKKEPENKEIAALVKKFEIRTLHDERTGNLKKVKPDDVPEHHRYALELSAEERELIDSILDGNYVPKNQDADATGAPDKTEKNVEKKIDKPEEGEVKKPEAEVVQDVGERFPHYEALLALRVAHEKDPQNKEIEDLFNKFDIRSRYYKSDGTRLSLNLADVPDKHKFAFELDEKEVALLDSILDEVISKKTFFENKDDQLENETEFTQRQVLEALNVAKIKEPENKEIAALVKKFEIRTLHDERTGNLKKVKPDDVPEHHRYALELSAEERELIDSILDGNYVPKNQDADATGALEQNIDAASENSGKPKEKAKEKVEKKGSKNETPKTAVDAEEEEEEAKKERAKTLHDLILQAQEGGNRNESAGPDPKEKKDQEEKAKAEEKPKGIRQLGAIQTDLMEKRAREIAAENMTRDKAELRGVSGFFKKIWKHNWMAEYYRAKEIKRVKGEMLAAGSTQGTEDAGGNGDRRIKDAILERFLRESPGMLHEVSGEWKDKLEGSPVTPEQKAEAEATIRQAIVDYVSNPDRNFAENNLTESINRVYANIFTNGNKNATKDFEPLNIADNIKDYAKELRGQVEHGAAIAELDLNFELTFGKAVTGARTEEAYSWVDKRVQEMAKSPIGRWVNTTTLAAAFCIGTAIATRAASWSWRAILGVLGGGMVAGGTLASITENQAIKRDRAEHTRDMAAGRAYNPDTSKRRNEINETTYSMLPVKDVIESLNTSIANIESTDPNNLNEQQILELLSMVGSVDARINLSDEKKIDLLSYSDPKEIEIERTKLDIARAEAKVVARKAYERLGLANTLGDFESYCESQATAERNSAVRDVEGDIEAKDQTFAKLKRRRTTAAFFKGAAVAGVAGTLFRGAINGVHALHEHLTADPYTPSEEVNFSGPVQHHNINVGGHPHDIANSTLGSLKVPEGFHIVDGTNPNEYRIIEGGHFDAGGHLVGGHVKVDHVFIDKTVMGPNGHAGSYSLTPDSEDALRKAGFGVANHSETTRSMSNFTTEHTVKFSPHEYTSQHPEFERTHRLGWADNGTKVPDLNERRLSDPILGRDGKIHFSMRGMTHQGSSVGHHKHLDVIKMASEGRMRILVSASRDTQFTPAHIPVRPDGTAVIDPNSPVGRLFKFDAHGHIIGRPKFTEAAVIMGEHNGIKNVIVCATDKGHGMSTVVENMRVQGVRELVSTKVDTVLSYEKPVVPFGPIIPIPFFIPRSPLERLNNLDNKKKENGKPQSPELDPKAEVLSNSGEYFQMEIDGVTRWVDKEGNPISRDVEREKQNIKEYLAKQAERWTLDIEGGEKKIAPMNEKCRVAINIPARNEQANFENLLNQYTKQVDSEGKATDPDLYEINIFVNKQPNDTSDKSVEVIEKWKKKNPKYHVNVLVAEAPLNLQTPAAHRKLLADLALKRSINRPKSDGPLYIESDDADLFSVDKRLVSKLVRNFDQNPHLDVLRGVQDVQPEVMSKNDLLFFNFRLRSITEIALRKLEYRNVTKGPKFKYNRIISRGWNTAFTAEAYAQVGGYTPTTTGGGPEISEKVSILRGSKDDATGEIVPNTKTVDASGLRSTRKFADVIGKNADSIQGLTDNEILEGIKGTAEATIEQKPVYEKALNAMALSVMDRVNIDQADTAIKRVLWGMGLKETSLHYQIDQNHKVKLTDKGMEQIIKLLSDYKKEKKYRKGYVRQNAPKSATK